MRNVLVITVEGMSTGLVGAYGSNTGATPSLDELAAHGVVFDQCFVDALEVTRQLTSLTTARHAQQPPTDEPSLWRLLRQAGVPTRFLTDAPTVAEWAEAAGCERVTLIRPPPSEQPAEDADQCAVVALFAAAAEELAEDAPRGLVWIHSSGLRLPWDAPLALRSQFTDPDDPEPPSEVGPPAFDVTHDTDPDAVVGWGQVAAAQVALIDDSLGMLLSLVRGRPEASGWACCVVGLGGVPLGEHGRVGWGRPQLHGEELHCAAIVQPWPAAPIGWRRAELCQLPDLGATLRECCGLAPEAHEAWGRSLLQPIPSDDPARWPNAHKLAILQTHNQIWLRSPAWSALWQASEEAGRPDSQLLDDSWHPKLYVKPDDRWEVSEIADRCCDITDALRQHALSLLAALAQNDRAALPELERPLCELLR